MSEVRPIPVAELAKIVVDAAELSKGTQIADKGGLAHLSQHGAKLFADAEGSGATPYKVQITFGDGKVTGRCSCMAARSRPFCKHAAALLVAWAKTPTAFAAVEQAPAGAPGEAKKKASIKKSSVDAKELLRTGVEQAETLLLELWQTGIGMLASDRPQQVLALGQSLRELGLSRLSARMISLSEYLQAATRRNDSLSQSGYAALVSDMWLTVRKLQKHLDGEALAAEHVEELIGKTWSKKERSAVAGTQLFEYAFLERVTADNFLLRESRLFDVVTGNHYCEKQILPAAIAKRTTPKPSYAGAFFANVAANAYPGFAPVRLDLETLGEAKPLTVAVVERALAQALPNVTACLAALAERRKDVFAPPWIPTLVAIRTVVPFAGKLRFVDDSGATLFFGGDPEREAALVASLAECEPLAIFGDVTLAGSLPTLHPLALIARKNAVLTLIALGVDDATSVLETADKSQWIDDAKAAGSANATILSEARDDLGAVFVSGKTGLTQRFCQPIASRLSELGFAKQAESLNALVGKEPADALDGVVKLFQVLGIGVTRLVGSTTIDLSTLVRLPTMPALAIEPPPAALSSQQAIARHARGELNRYERDYHIGTELAAVKPEVLIGNPFRYWGDGYAISFVYRAIAAEPQLAQQAAATASQLIAGKLLQSSPDQGHCRLLLTTALGILARCEKLSVAQVGNSPVLDPALKGIGRILLGGSVMSDEKLAGLINTVAGGATKEQRVNAIGELAGAGAIAAIPTLRLAMQDRAKMVREAACFALAAMCDTGSLALWCRWVETNDFDLGKTAIYALGTLGDLRAVGTLLQAFTEVRYAAIVSESLVRLGPWVVEPLLALVEEQPALAKRSPLAGLLNSYSVDALQRLTQWIVATADATAQVARATRGYEAARNTKAVVEYRAWLTGEFAALHPGSKEVAALVRKATAPQKTKAAPASK